MRFAVRSCHSKTKQSGVYAELRARPHWLALLNAQCRKDATASNDPALIIGRQRAGGTAPSEHQPATVQPGERKALMANIDVHVIKFQCPSCGHDLEQNIGRLKSGEHMQCPGCGIGINVDTDRLANAAEEMHKALGKVPPEITIKFYR